jgi:hypothetical protein
MMLREHDLGVLDYLHRMEGSDRGGSGLIEEHAVPLSPTRSKARQSKQSKPEKSDDHARWISTSTKAKYNIDQASLSTEFDKTLLAVIGIVDALRPESNVSGWIRAGGLWAGKGTSTAIAKNSESRPKEEELERAPSPTDVEVCKKADIGEALGNDAETVAGTGTELEETTEKESKSKEVPSTGERSVSMWFEDVETFEEWVARGREALKALGIPERHGIC